MEDRWGFYVVEVSMLISEGNTEVEMRSIADKRTRWGNPMTELLATDTTENCHFILDGLKMINIHFE